MNEVKRMSISMTEDMEQRIVNLRKTDRFCRASYAEIIREILRAGLGVISSTEDTPAQRD